MKHIRCISKTKDWALVRNAALTSVVVNLGLVVQLTWLPHGYLQGYPLGYTLQLQLNYLWTSFLHQFPYTAFSTLFHGIFLLHLIFLFGNPSQSQKNCPFVLPAKFNAQIFLPNHLSLSIWLFLVKISALQDNPSKVQQNCPFVLPAK